MPTRNVFTAVTLAALLASTAAACGGPKPVKPGKAEQAQKHEATTTVDLRTTPPPWPAPMHDNAKYVDAAGLPAFTSEKTLVHYHAHLDIIDDGKPVTVPADIGIVFKNGQAVAISPLHTHTPDGVLHVEAERNAKFTLGQLFTEWGVRLSSTCVGGLCADRSHEIAFAVDGVPYEGDPGEIALKPHEEIAIVYGAKGNLPKPPASYNFPKGL